MNLEDIQDKLGRTLLRSRFSKFVKPDQKPEKLRRMLMALNRHYDTGLNNAFFQWKFQATNDKLNNEIKQLKPQSNIVEGVNKLDKIHRKKPRKGVKAFSKNRNHRIQQDSALKKLLLNFRARLSNQFFNWSDKVRNYALKDEILEVADRAFNLPGLKKILDNLERKPLRSAFEKIKGKRDKGSLKVALLLLKGYHDDELRRLFHLWALFTHKGKNDEQKAALSKRPHFVDGASCLANLLARGPRHALRQLGKNSNHEVWRKGVIRRFKLMFNKCIGASFILWAKKAGIRTEAECLAKFNKGLDSLHPLHLLLHLRPMRYAFENLKQTRTKNLLTKFCKNFTLSLNNGVHRAYYVWKFAALEIAKTKQAMEMHRRTDSDRGVQMLQASLHKVTREVLRNLKRNAYEKNLLAKSVKKIMLMYKGGLLNAFLIWAKQAGLSAQKDEIFQTANDTFKLFSLMKRPFDKSLNLGLRMLMAQFSGSKLNYEM